MMVSRSLAGPPPSRQGSGAGGSAGAGTGSGVTAFWPQPRERSRTNRQPATRAAGARRRSRVCCDFPTVRLPVCPSVYSSTANGDPPSLALSPAAAACAAARVEYSPARTL